MPEWIIIPSYKYDLAAFCNLFTLHRTYQELHQASWDRFRALVEASPENVGLAQQLRGSGVIVSSALTAIFDSHDYNGLDIDEICSVMDDPHLRSTQLRSYFLDTGIMEPGDWDKYEPLMPMMSSLVKYVHSGGFLEFWQNRCLPEIQERCQELEEESTEYPVIGLINELLGERYALREDTITVYLCKHSAPHGTSLRGQGFVSDIRWELENTVCIALHELMHPPFDRGKISRIAERLVADELVICARSRLDEAYYSTPLFFLEENIVEGAHIYLAEQLGLEQKPLQYFVDHDNATHVISPLVYDALCRWQDDRLSLEQVVDRMVDQRLLEPGNIKPGYLEIYSRAMIDHPYKA